MPNTLILIDQWINFQCCTCMVCRFFVDVFSVIQMRIVTKNLNNSVYCIHRHLIVDIIGIAH